jgi:hypothetical protein
VRERERDKRQTHAGSDREREIKEIGKRERDAAYDSRRNKNIEPPKLLSPSFSLSLCRPQVSAICVYMNTTHAPVHANHTDRNSGKESRPSYPP